MQRIPTLLQKLSELAQKGDKNTAIDIDLMMDYTRVMYADLMEWRNRVAFVAALPDNQPAAPVKEAPPIAQVDKSPEPKPQQEVKPVAVQEPIVPAPPKPQPSPVAASKADIRTFIGINDKYLFMSELFGNNKEDYEAALDNINASKTAREANSWINENVFYVRNEDEGADTLDLLRGIVDAYFSNN